MTDTPAACAGDAAGPAGDDPSSAGSPRRRTYAVLAVAAVIALAAVALTASRLAAASPGRGGGGAAAQAGGTPRPAFYLGVYEASSPRSYAGVADFGRVAGRQPNLAGYFSGWAEPFATSFAEQAYRHHAVVLVQIDPSYASVAAIANGSYDSYLRSYADSVRRFGHAVIIGFGHEMNAPWYSWGYPHVRPATFVAAWRHVVRLFRGQGADNATWLWTINTDLPRSGPVAQWWPGSAYVTWVGVDGYFYRPSDTFTSVFGTTIRQVRTFTRKPVLLAETAAGPAAGQPGKIAGLFAGLRRERALGLVWFDEDQHAGIYHQDWRLVGGTPAAAAFRRAVSALTPAYP
ncbi:MAG: glycoside hydrolase family 26 protein [Streptosporangiaceae bacterium]